MKREKNWCRSQDQFHAKIRLHAANTTSNQKKGIPSVLHIPHTFPSLLSHFLFFLSTIFLRIPPMFPSLNYFISSSSFQHFSFAFLLCFPLYYLISSLSFQHFPFAFLLWFPLYFIFPLFPFNSFPSHSSYVSLSICKFPFVPKHFFTSLHRIPPHDPSTGSLSVTSFPLYFKQYYKFSSSHISLVVPRLWWHTSPFRYQGMDRQTCCILHN